jgi:hypothetical protein
MLWMLTSPCSTAWTLTGEGCGLDLCLQVYAASSCMPPTQPARSSAHHTHNWHRTCLRLCNRLSTIQLVQWFEPYCCLCSALSFTAVHADAAHRPRGPAVHRATCLQWELTRAPLHSGHGCTSMAVAALQWPTYWTPQVPVESIKWMITCLETMRFTVAS